MGLLNFLFKKTNNPITQPLRPVSKFETMDDVTKAIEKERAKLRGLSYKHLANELATLKVMVDVKDDLVTDNTEDIFTMFVVLVHTINQLNNLNEGKPIEKLDVPTIEDMEKHMKAVIKIQSTNS
jgi:hypothetical protein